MRLQFGQQVLPSLRHEGESVDMTPYKGTPSSKTIAREISYVVETVVPEGGLGRRLEDMHDFHRQRAITDHYVPRRRNGERDYIRGTHLRGQIRSPVPIRRRRGSVCCDTWRAESIR